MDKKQFELIRESRKFQRKKAKQISLDIATRDNTHVAIKNKKSAE